MAATIPGAGITTPLTLTTADNTDTLTLKSTDADANAGPILNLIRDSGSPADADFIGGIKYTADNDANEATEFAKIDCQIDDASNGTEDGQLFIRGMSAGTLRNRIAVYGSSTVINDDSIDVDFRVESDDSNKAFFVNGTKGHCHISGASSATKVMSYSGGMGALQLGVGGGIYSYDYNPVDGPYIANNAYSDAGTERYVGSGHAGRLGIYTGILLFHNAGNGSADGTITYSERFRIAQNGDITATDTSIGSNSDERLKENIKDFTYDVAKFKQFKPKTFDWKNPELHNGVSGNRGFIAQEIETVDDYYINKEELILRETEKTGDADYNLIPKDEDGKRISYTSKFGKKDAMYISVIQQLIARIEALESA